MRLSEPRRRCGRKRLSGHPGDRCEHGFSLLELLAAIVVLSLIFAGFVSVYATALRHGSDGELHGQAVAIAAAYLDEAMSRPYRDPDDGLLCGAPEAVRPAFDDVCDYDQLALNGCTATTADCPQLGDCPCDRSGAPVDGLRAFRVSVDVAPLNLSGASGLRLSVGVTHDGLAGNGVTLEAFRAED